MTGKASGYLVLRGIGLPVAVPLTAVRAVQDAVRQHKVLVLPDGGAGGDDAWENRNGEERGNEEMMQCSCDSLFARPVRG